MISHAALCQACIDLYAASAPPSANGVVYSVTKVGETDIITLRGSETAVDWLLDFVAAPVFDRDLGFVHAGFLFGMREVYDAVSKGVGQSVAITGHSLGGARARVLAALFAVNGRPVQQLVTFGSPRPAFTNLRRIIEKTVTEHVSYRNRNDCVVLVPFPIPFQDWEHTEDWTSVNIPAAPTDLSVLRDHHIALYLEALSGPV